MADRVLTPRMSGELAFEAVWSEMPCAAKAVSPRWRTLGSRALISFAAAVAFVATGHARAAMFVIILVVVITSASAVRPRAGAAIERWLAAFARAVGFVLSVVVLALIEALVFAPLSLLLWVFRRDPLSASGRSRGWRGVEANHTLLADRPFTVEAHEGHSGSRAQRVLRATPAALGVMVLLVTVDFSAGFAYDEFVGSHDVPSTLHSSASGPAEREAERERQAMAPYPWWGEYLDELEGLRYDYEPYLYTRLLDTEGRYINSLDGIRRSYEPEGVDPCGMGEVWFFGGSTMWGDNQRDLYTIPSQVARLAEADGNPIQVVNFGRRGYVNWQEMLLFEQELAHRPAPDLVVFYDGLNDVSAQVSHLNDDPTQLQFEQAYESITGDDRYHAAPLVAPVADLSDLWDRYLEVSALGKIVRRTDDSGAVGDLAAAAEGIDPHQVEEATVDVYQRGVRIERHLAETNGAAAVFFWQPVRAAPAPYPQIADAVGDVAIDLTSVLVEPASPVYTDDGHTNELGAALVARAMYEHLRPQIVRAGGPCA